MKISNATLDSQHLRNAASSTPHSRVTIHFRCWFLYFQPVSSLVMRFFFCGWSTELWQVDLCSKSRLFGICGEESGVWGFPFTKSISFILLVHRSYVI